VALNVYDDLTERLAEETVKREMAERELELVQSSVRIQLDELRRAVSHCMHDIEYLKKKLKGGS
jgi:hypothetical protein